MSFTTYPNNAFVEILKQTPEELCIRIPCDSSVEELFIYGAPSVSVFPKKEISKIDLDSSVKDLELIGAQVENIYVGKSCTVSGISNYKTCTMRDIPNYVAFPKENDVFVYPLYITPPTIANGTLFVKENVQKLLIKSPLLKVVDLNGLSLDVVELGNECIGKITFTNGNVKRVVRHTSQTKIIETDDCQIKDVITEN